MITKYIGQTGAVATLNEILEAHTQMEKKGEHYAFRPVNLAGYTGTGKSNLANCFAEQLEQKGFNYIQVTPNAGWRDLYSVFGKIKSEDEDKGTISAIPHVVFWDEIQSQKIAWDLLKALMTKVDEIHTIRRQGFNFHYDPQNHVHIFASNCAIDKAAARRCINVALGTYSKAEMARLATLFLETKNGVKLSNEAMETLLSRTKPLAGDLEELVSPLVNRAKSLNKTKLDQDTVLDVLKKQGYFPRGLRKPDMAIINQLLASGTSTSAVLKFKCQDDKKKDTQERVDWLCSIDLVQPVRGGFSLTKNGVKYAEEIAALQKAAKAARK